MCSTKTNKQKVGYAQFFAACSVKRKVWINKQNKNQNGQMSNNKCHCRLNFEWIISFVSLDISIINKSVLKKSIDENNQRIFYDIRP